MRAILFAIATTTTFGGRRPARRNTHLRGALLWTLAARALCINKVRRYLSPRLEILSMRSLPLVPMCRGVRPSQAANSRPDLNAAGSPIAATKAVAPS